jgi:hypothetical protein
MIKLRRFAFAMFAVALLGAVAAPPVAARDQGSLGTASPKKTHLELDGTPLAGVYADPAVGAFAEIRPPVCRAATYCDAFEFEVDYPKEYLREVFFGISIELTWENPRTKSNDSEQANDVDMFVWGDDGEASGGPLSQCGSPYDEKCNLLYPEVVTITEPPNTIAEDADPAAIYVTVVNHSGVNTGYHVNVDWFTFDLPPPPAFTPPEREISGQQEPTVSGPFDFGDVTKAKTGEATPAPTPRKILVPGPDGKLHEIELPIYAAGNRLGATADRNEALPWIIAGIVGAIALAGLIFYLARKNRQAMEGW